MIKQVLIVGGSENLLDEENQNYHYITLLQQLGKYEIKNISMGNMSCAESFYRCVPEIEQTDYDLVIILWTPVWRKWVYFSDNNIDDFTVIAPGSIIGFNKESSAADQYNKLYHAYFNNQYINTHRFLSQVLLMQSYFKVKNIPLVMCRDGRDYITDILATDYIPGQGIINVSDILKEILDFDNRPDYYILQKLNVLKLLIGKIDRSLWIDFENFRFEDQKVDLHSDGHHAGPVSHANFFKLLISKLEEHQLV
jgi:hypothetical protein